MNESNAVIVTFNPDDQTVEVLQKLVLNNANIIIVDNGSNRLESSINKVEDLIDSLSNIYYYRFDRNVGLATAQNKGVEMANSLSGKYVFFFDQDTVIPEDFIPKMESLFAQYEFKFPENKLGILAPNYFDRNTKEYAHYAKLTDKSYEDKKFKGEKFMEVSFVISSGSMMKLSVFNELGNYLDEFFIDQVDTEYSLRMLKNNYKIIATSELVLNHTIGNREKKKFLWLTIKPNHHSELRKYYIFRNGMVTIRKYGTEFPGFKVLMVKRFIHDFLGVLLYEKRKLRKIKMMITGITDAKKVE